MKPHDLVVRHPNYIKKTCLTVRLHKHVQTGVRRYREYICVVGYISLDTVHSGLKDFPTINICHLYTGRFLGVPLITKTRGHKPPVASQSMTAAPFKLLRTEVMRWGMADTALVISMVIEDRWWMLLVGFQKCTLVKFYM